MNAIEVGWSISEVLTQLRQRGYHTTTHNLRIYERRGLLSPIERASGVFRRYSNKNLHEIMFVMDQLELGLTMKQTKEIKLDEDRIERLREEILHGSVRREREKVEELLASLVKPKMIVEKYQRYARAVTNQSAFYNGIVRNIRAIEEVLFRMSK